MNSPAPEKTESLLQLVQRMDELGRRLSRLELIAESRDSQDAIAAASSQSTSPELAERPGDEEPTLDYFWVVICKNHRFHQKENLSYRHRILLGETDSYSPLPMLPDQFKVHCDSCGKKYSYARKEVLRADLHHPESFAPHPLFSTSP